MPTPKPLIDGVPSAYLSAAVTALRYKAHDQAGHSEGSGSFDQEDTYDWAAADALQALLEQAGVKLPK